MRTAAFGALGAVLIFGAHCAAPYLRDPGTVELIYDLRAPNGRPGFAAIFDAWAWWSLTGQSVATNGSLSKGAAENVRGEINRVLAKTPHNCPDRWLLLSTTALHNGNVALTGYCASQAELESE